MQQLKTYKITATVSIALLLITFQPIIIYACSGCGSHGGG